MRAASTNALTTIVTLPLPTEATSRTTSIVMLSHVAITRFEKSP
jgi:hypothetical protein